MSCVYSDSERIASVVLDAGMLVEELDELCEDAFFPALGVRFEPPIFPAL
jgi:hypothetical protein